MRPYRSPAALILIGAALAASACGGNADTEQRLAELRSERRSLVIQFFAAQNAIRRLQARALEEPAVAAQQDSFYAVFRDYVERTDPEGAALIARANLVGQDLEFLSAPLLLVPGEENPRMSDEERRQVAAELVEVERLLRPVTDRALSDSAVAARFQALQDSLVGAMLRLEPASRTSLDLMTELEGKISALDAEMRTLEN